MAFSKVATASLKSEKRKECDSATYKGIDKQQASFCYPVELAHGFFQSLIDQKPDYIFLPHIKEVSDAGKMPDNKTCVLLQSESYYLKSTFKESNIES